MKMRVQKACGLFIGITGTCIFLILGAIAQAQNLFVADFGGSRVYEFNPHGTQSTFASGLSNPIGLAFDCAGNLFVSEYTASDVLKFTPGGVKSVYASGIIEPTGLAFDHSGNLFVASARASITEIDTNGVQSTFASGLSLGNPYGLAFDRAGNLFAADPLRNVVDEFATNGSMTVFASGLGSPVAVAFDCQSNLYVANAFSNSIIQFPPGGTQTNFASVFNPWGMVFNNGGFMFITVGTGGGIMDIKTAGDQSMFASGFTNLIGLAFQPTPKLAVTSVGGAVHLTVSIPSPSPLSQMIVQTSTDLMNWSNVYTNVSPFVFTNPVDLGAPYRFYRTVMWP